MAIITTPLPFVFSNGTTADATQVNADLNQIVSNVNANAAANGANGDITSMSAVASMSHALSLGSTLGVTGLLTASGGVSGAVTGNVTGNVSGNVTGNIVGPSTYSDGTTTSEPGWRDIPQNTQSGNYSLALVDRGRSINCTNAGAQTITIPANASVAFPLGTVITVVNGGTTAVSIAITSDTLRLAGSPTTGTRTLAVWGMATLYKQNTTVWLCAGAGVS